MNELKDLSGHTILTETAMSGELAILKFFMEGDFNLRADQATIYGAVTGGLDIVKYLVEDCGVTDFGHAWNYAEMSGKNEIASYFQEKNAATHKKLCS